MADKNSLLKLKFKLKGIYNNAIQKPIKDMCLFEMDEELTYKLKDVNRTGKWDNRADAIIVELLSRRYYEKDFGAEMFLNIIDQLGSDDLKKEFVHRYAGIISEQTIDKFKEIGISVGRELYPYVQQLQAETFEKYGDFEKIPRDRESELIIGKQLKPNQIAEMILKHKHEFAGMDVDLSKLSKSEKMQILVASDTTLLLPLPDDFYNDITIEDIKSYAKETGNYEIFDRAIPSLHKYYENITFDDIQEFLQVTTDKELQKNYLSRAITIFYDRGNLSQDEYIELANDERIENTANIYGRIFNNQNFEYAMQTIADLPEDKQQYAITAAERVYRDEMRNEAVIKRIYDAIKSTETKTNFMIRAVNNAKGDKFAVFKKEDVINAMKEDSNRYYKHDIYAYLSQDELFDLYMETKDEGVSRDILGFSFDAIKRQNNPRTDEDDFVWGGETEKHEIPNIITKENIYDIFEKIDLLNEFYVSELINMEGFDCNHKGVLKKLYSNPKGREYINWISSQNIEIDAKTALEAFQESNLKSRNDAWDLCRLNLKWNTQDENGLYNSLMAISGIDDIYCQNIFLEEGLLQKNYGLHREGMIFDIPEIDEAIKNESIPMQMRCNLLSQAMGSYYRQLEGNDFDGWLAKFNQGLFRFGRTDDEENNKVSPEEQLLSDANVMIDMYMNDLPKKFVEEYSDGFSRAKSTDSLEEKAMICSELNMKAVDTTHDMLMKKLEDFSKMSGIDHYSLLKQIEADQDANPMTVRYVIFKYIKLIPYINNKEMFDKFKELYANNENVINSITVEILQPEVFANIDNNLIEYLSAYGGTGDRVSDVIGNENLLQLFTRSYEYLQQANEFSEEQIAKVLKYIGKNAKKLVKDEYTEDDIITLSYIANYDEDYTCPEDASIFDYGEIQKSYLDKKIKSTLLTRATAIDTFGKRFFSMGYDELKKLAYNYGHDVDNFITNYEAKQALTPEEENELTALKIAKNIRRILEVDDIDTIKKMYADFSKMPEYQAINLKERLVFDENIRRPYTKEYKSKIYIPNEKDKKIVDGVSVYAPKDFYMFVNSVGAYSNFSITDENESAKDLWNTNKDTARHEICTSLISSENMGRAGLKQGDKPLMKLVKKIVKKISKSNEQEEEKEQDPVIVTFYDFSDNAIFMAGSHDIASEARTIESQLSYRDFSFKRPDNLIDDTRLMYNEINIKTKNMNNLRDALEPQGVVCFDEITDDKKKVAADFNSDIIYIDSKEIAKIQSNQLSNMFQQFYENPNPELVGEILNKYENNRNSFYFSRPDLQYKYFNPSKFASNMVKAIKCVQECGAKGDNETFKTCMDAFYIAIHNEIEKFRFVGRDHELLSNNNLQIRKINKALSKAISNTDYTVPIASFEEQRNKFINQYYIDDGKSGIADMARKHLENNRTTNQNKNDKGRED